MLNLQLCFRWPWFFHACWCEACKQAVVRQASEAPALWYALARNEPRSLPHHPSDHSHSTRTKSSDYCYSPIHRLARRCSLLLRDSSARAPQSTTPSLRRVQRVSCSTSSFGKIANFSYDTNCTSPLAAASKEPIASSIDMLWSSPA